METAVPCEQSTLPAPSDDAGTAHALPMPSELLPPPPPSKPLVSFTLYEDGRYIRSCAGSTLDCSAIYACADGPYILAVKWKCMRDRLEDRQPKRLELRFASLGEAHGCARRMTRDLGHPFVCSWTIRHKSKPACDYILRRDCSIGDECSDADSENVRNDTDLFDDEEEDDEAESDDQEEEESDHVVRKRRVLEDDGKDGDRRKGRDEKAPRQAEGKTKKKPPVKSDPRDKEEKKKKRKRIVCVESSAEEGSQSESEDGEEE